MQLLFSFFLERKKMRINFFRKKSIEDPILKKERRKEQLLLSLSGLMLGAGFTPSPFPQLLFAALIPYLIVINKRVTLASINRATFLMAFVFNLLTVYWVGGFVVGKDYFLMVSGVLLLFVNPLVNLIPSTLYYMTYKNFGRKTAMFLFPFFWVCSEYLYMITDWSFPWLTIGNGVSKFLHYVQFADLLGSQGVSLFVLYANVFFFFAFFRRDVNPKPKKIYVTAALIVIILPLLYGMNKIEEPLKIKKEFTIGLIQPDLDPYDKWSGGNLDAITNLYLSLSQKAIDKGAQLIVWPETALPVYLLAGPYSDTRDSLSAFLVRNNVWLLSGMPDIQYYYDTTDLPDDVKYSSVSEFYYTTYNAIYLFSQGYDLPQKYRKMKLVPFGEKTPFSDKIPFLADLIKWGVGLGGWNVGKDTSVLVANISSDSLHIGALVCYESIYPHFVSSFTDKGADMIAVVTNDSWYGNTSGPYQHKDFASLRAIENRRYVVRAANGGVSCIINPKGETVLATKMYEKNFLVGKIGVIEEKTFFTQNPNLVTGLASLLSFWCFVFFWLKKFYKKKEE